MTNKVSDFYNKKSNVYKVPVFAGSLYDVVFKLIEPGKKVLDVGCANGIFSSNLRRRNNNKVTGIEVSDKMAIQAKKSLDRVIVGDIELIELPLRMGEFDYILLMDILEHTFDPYKVIKKLRPYLKKKGQFIVTLPNIANWQIRSQLVMGKFQYEDSGILDSGHIRFFTYESALEMFQLSGLKLVRSESICKFPTIVVKLDNKIPFIRIQPILKKFLPRVFAFQYLFVLSKI